MWLAYSKMHSLKVYHLISFELCIYPLNYHHSQDKGQTHLPREFPLVHSCCFLSSTLTPGNHQSCPTLQPHGLWPARLLCAWDFPGKNSGVGCHFLLQGIFPTQGSNPRLLHCRWILYCWATREAPSFTQYSYFQIHLCCVWMIQLCISIYMLCISIQYNWIYIQCFL